MDRMLLQKNPQNQNWLSSQPYWRCNSYLLFSELENALFFIVNFLFQFWIIMIYPEHVFIHFFLCFPLKLDNSSWHLEIRWCICSGLSRRGIYRLDTCRMTKSSFTIKNALPVEMSNTLASSVIFICWSLQIIAAVVGLLCRIELHSLQLQLDTNCIVG